MKRFTPTLTGIEIGAALLASITTLVVLDTLGFDAASNGGITTAVAVVLLAMAMLAVCTTFSAYLHVYKHAKTAVLSFGLEGLAWALAVIILAPVLFAVVPLALMAMTGVAAAVLSQMRSPQPASN